METFPSKNISISWVEKGSLLRNLSLSFGFAILSFINYRKSGKTLETIYLSILTVFFIVCFIILNFY